jgi:Tetrapyrrole (Corrin/Porphyrin) Methylases
MQTTPTLSTEKPKGSLVIVSLGMTLGSHLSPLSRSYLTNSDVVFAGVSDGLVELWLKELHPDVRSLQPHYVQGRSRLIGYRAMVQEIMSEVRAGKNVCGAFYGHAGVFAIPPHKAIETARAEGFRAHMEPGISAEDCLYADLGIDPGTFGCQHFEASQLMFYRRQIDTSAYLILWQVGIAGDRSLSKFATPNAYRELLVELLARNYPLSHAIIIYRVATLPTGKSRIEHVTLADLAKVTIELADTVVLPPARPMQRNDEFLARLQALAEAITDIR